MTQSRQEEKLGFVIADTKILILLKDKKYDEVKIYIKQLLNHLPVIDACREMECLIDAADDPEKLRESIDLSDQKKLLFGAMKKFKPVVIDFLLQKNFALQISDKYFIHLLIFLLQKNILQKAKLLIEWREELGDCDVLALLHYVLGLVFQHQITLEKPALQLLCFYGVDPLQKFEGKMLVQHAIEMDNGIAVEFFLDDNFINKYTKDALVTIFELLIKEGWFSDAGILLTKKQDEIMSLLSAMELDAIFCAVANETYHHVYEIELKDNENLLKTLLKLGANPARILPVEGIPTNAFSLMTPAWDWMLSTPYVNYLTEENLLSVLIVCANSLHLKRNSLIKMALLQKEHIFNDSTKALDYIFYKLNKDQMIDNELYEHLLFLGANPFASFGSHNVFDIVWKAKHEYKIECILEKYIQDLTPSMLAVIYTAAVKHHWHPIQDIMASGKNIKKTLMLEQLQIDQAKKLIADVLRDDKPDQDFMHDVMKHPNVEISFNESVLEYAMKNSDMIKEMLAATHHQLLPFAQGYHALQYLFYDDNFEVRFANLELLKYFNQMSAENYLKRKGLTGILHHEIHKAKAMTEVMQIIKFIEAHKKNYPFMRNNFLHDDWKILKFAAMSRIQKIASDHQVIVFSNATESEEIRGFMNPDSKCHFFHSKKNSYDELVKNKIQILANESLSKRIFPH